MKRSGGGARDGEVAAMGRVETASKEGDAGTIQARMGHGFMVRQGSGRHRNSEGGGGTGALP